jgi:hypothetical protein
MLKIAWFNLAPIIIYAKNRRVGINKRAEVFRREKILGVKCLLARG